MIKKIDSLVDKFVDWWIYDGEKKIGKIEKRLILINEGEKFIDKFKIVLWLFGYKNNSINISNEDGNFYVRPNSSDLWMISTMGEFEMEKYFEGISEGTFLDVGSNIGKYVIRLSKKYPNLKCYAIEPEKDNFDMIIKNCYINGLLNKIKIKKLAFSDKKEELKLFMNPTNNGGHSLVREHNDFEVVDCVTLDSFVEENDIKDLSLLKIDVEGAELKVLKGAIKTLKEQSPRMIIEINSDFEEIFSLFDSLGYSLKKISDIDYLAQKSYYTNC